MGAAAQGCDDCDGSGSGRSRWSLWSRDSFLCIASQGSVLSIGSVGSALSIGSIGSSASLFSVGSFASAGSAMSALSRSSLMSFRSDGKVMGQDPGPLSPPARLVAVGLAALAVTQVVRARARRR